MREWHRDRSTEVLRSNLRVLIARYDFPLPIETGNSGLPIANATASALGVCRLDRAFQKLRIRELLGWEHRGGATAVGCLQLLDVT